MRLDDKLLVNLYRCCLNGCGPFNVTIVLQERPAIHEELKLSLGGLKLSLEPEVLRSNEETYRLCIWPEDVNIAVNV